MEYTGHSGCRGTPYLEWRETLSPYHAQAEVYFLRSVDYHFFGEGSQARVDAMLARRRG